jgi:hypothetical protein
VSLPSLHLALRVLTGMDVAEALGSNAAQAMGFQLFAPVADNVSLGLPGASGA